MKSKIVYFIISLVFGISCFISPVSQGGEIMSMQEEFTDLQMSYHIEGAYSPYKYIQISISATGEANLDYEVYREYVSKAQSEKKTINFKVEKNVLKELLELYQKVDFFNIEVYDLNKDRIQVTDVGTTTLSLSYGGEKRSISYGYIKDNPFRQILKLYQDLIKEHLPKKR